MSIKTVLNNRVVDLRGVKVSNQDRDAFDLMLHALEDLKNVVSFGDTTKLEIRAPELIMRARLINAVVWFFLRDDIKVNNVLSLTKQALELGNEGFNAFIPRMGVLSRMMLLNPHHEDLKDFEYHPALKELWFYTDKRLLVVPIETQYLRNLKADNAMLRDLFFMDARNIFKKQERDPEMHIDEILDSLVQLPEYSAIKAALVL